MKILSDKSAEKLQKILSKRFGRRLTQEELEEAYFRLMEFATALIDLYSSDHEAESNQSLQT